MTLIRSILIQPGPPCKTATSRASMESFEMSISTRAGLRHCKKQGMQYRSGNRTTTRSDYIGALKEFQLLNSPIFIGSALPMKMKMKMNPSTMKPFISMFMQTRLRGEHFGRACAVRSKRENAMPEDGIAEGKSPTDGF